MSRAWLLACAALVCAAPAPEAARAGAVLPFSGSLAPGLQGSLAGSAEFLSLAGGSLGTADRFDGVSGRGLLAAWSAAVTFRRGDGERAWWVSAGVRRSVGAEAGPAYVVPGAGMRASWKGLQLSGSLGQEPRTGIRRVTIPGIAAGDSMAPGTGGTVSQAVSEVAQVAQLRVQWSGRALDLAATGGAAIAHGIGPRSWLTLDGQVWVTRCAAVGLVATTRTEYLGSGTVTLPPGVRLGFTFDPGRSAGEAPARPVAPEAPAGLGLRAAGPGRWRLTLPGGAERLAEVAGDFSSWEPVPMARNTGGDWEVELELGPGAHHVCVRFDGGEWLPPPGLPAAGDGFGGRVGILVLE